MPRELQPKQPDPGDQSAYNLGMALGAQLYGDLTKPQIARQTYLTEREVEQRPDGSVHARERELLVDEYYSPLTQHREPPPSNWLRRLLGD